MVTLRPDHPHPIASASRVTGSGGAIAFLKSLAASPERGVHRGSLDYVPYRSVHQDIKRSGLVRFLPTWRQRVGPPRVQLSPTFPLATAARPLEPEPLPSEPAPTRVVQNGGDNGPSSSDQSLLHRSTAPQGASHHLPSDFTVSGQAGDATPPAADTAVSAEASPNGSVTSSSIRSGNPFRPLTGSARRNPSGILYELERSRLLPPAHPSEGSSLAAVLGFGEKEASFAGYRLERGEPSPMAEQADDPWQDLPSLSTVTAELERPGNTGDAVRLLWEATAEMDTAEMDMDADLLASEVSPVEIEFRSRRRIRWSIVLAMALLVALLAVTAKIVTDLPARQAQEMEGQYVASAQQLRSSLGPLEQTLADGGLMSGSGLSILTDHLYTLESVARAAATLSAHELPGRSIPGSDQAVENLVLPRQLLESAAGNSLGITQRIGNAMTYSLAFSNVVDLPTLPEEASPAEAGAIADELSLSIAEIQVTLSGLPDDVFFQPYLDEASQTMRSLETSQADYIAALQTGDTAGASLAGESMRASVESLRSGLRLPLDHIRTWALMEIQETQETAGQIESLIAT